MAVTAVNPYANTHGGVDAESVRTYTNLYDVYTDDKNDGSIAARGSDAIALGLPAYNDRWEWYNDFDDYALAKTRSADLIDADLTRKKWRVTIGYTTKLQKRDPASDQAEPENEPWKISGSFSVGTRTVERDREGKLNINSVNEKVFDEIPSAHDTLIMEGNALTIDLDLRHRSTLHCNSTPQWGLKARQWLLMQWSYDVLYKGIVPYIHNRLEWHASTYEGSFPGANENWDFVYIDKGTRILVDAAQDDPNLRYKPATARDVALINGVYLDGAGQPIDLTVQPGGFVIVKENIPEFDFLGNMPWLPNPLPGPFI